MFEINQILSHCNFPNYCGYQGRNVGQALVVQNLKMNRCCSHPALLLLPNISFQSNFSFLSEISVPIRKGLFTFFLSFYRICCHQRQGSLKISKNNYSRIKNDNLLIIDPKCLGGPCHGLRTQITVKSLAQPPESKHRPRTLSLSVGRTFVTCSMIFVDDENNEKPSFHFF